MATGKLQTEDDLQRFVEKLLEQRLKLIESKIAAIEARLGKAGI